MRWLILAFVFLASPAKASIYLFTGIAEIVGPIVGEEIRHCGAAVLYPRLFAVSTPETN